MTSSEPTIATRDEWLTARLELLEAEKELSRHRDQVSAVRRELPWVRVEQAYAFDTVDGPRSLADLFGDHSQLIVQHFMFGADWDEGCPSCSFWADSFNGTEAHLAARDTAFVLASNGPLNQLQAYRARMGWSLPWVSAGGTTFNHDFAVADSLTYNYRPVDEPIGESHGISSFSRQGSEVFHTYSTYARGVDPTNSTYQLLDLTAKGRDESDLPWPMAWLHRHDSYPG